MPIPNRMKAGYELWKNKRIKKTGHNEWKVKNSRGKCQRVWLIDNTDWWCSCEDFKFRNLACKHIYAAIFDTLFSWLG